MNQNARWVLVAIVLSAGLVFGAAGARADQKTPLWGWDDDGFSLWPVLYVGQGGFSIPGLRWTEDTFSIPFIHYESAPRTRFDLTPVYHYTEDQEGFFLGPARAEVNDGEQGIANWLFDLTTLVSNTRQYLADDQAGYERYREYGRSDLVIPGAGDGEGDIPSLAQKAEVSPPVDQAAPLEEEVRPVPPGEENDAASETKEERAFDDAPDPVSVPAEMM